MSAIELMKRSNRFGHQRCWQLCFDEKVGMFSVHRENNYKDVEDVGTVLQDERSSSQYFKTEISSNLKELGFHRIQKSIVTSRPNETRK